MFERIPEKYGYYDLTQFVQVPVDEKKEEDELFQKRHIPLFSKPLFAVLKTTYAIPANRKEQVLFYYCGEKEGVTLPPRLLNFEFEYTVKPFLDCKLVPLTPKPVVGCYYQNENDLSRVLYNLQVSRASTCVTKIGKVDLLTVIHHRSSKQHVLPLSSTASQSFEYINKDSLSSGLDNPLEQLDSIKFESKIPASSVLSTKTLLSQLNYNSKGRSLDLNGDALLYFFVQNGKHLRENHAVFDLEENSFAQTEKKDNLLVLLVDMFNKEEKALYENEIAAMKLRSGKDSIYNEYTDEQRFRYSILWRFYDTSGSPHLGVIYEPPSILKSKNILDNSRDVLVNFLDRLHSCEKINDTFFTHGNQGPNPYKREFGSVKTSHKLTIQRFFHSNPMLMHCEYPRSIFIKDASVVVPITVHVWNCTDIEKSYRFSVLGNDQKIHQNSIISVPAQHHPNLFGFCGSTSEVIVMKPKQQVAITLKVVFFQSGIFDLNRFVFYDMTHGHKGNHNKPSFRSHADHNKPIFFGFRHHFVDVSVGKADN